MELIGEGKILDLIELARKVGLSLAGGTALPAHLYEEGKFLLEDWIDGATAFSLIC